MSRPASCTPSWLARFLCWIGFHSWVYGTMHMDVRECRRCKKFEELYD